MQKKWTQFCREEHRLTREDGQLVQTYDEAAGAAKRLYRKGEQRVVYELLYKECFHHHWEREMAVDFMKTNGMRYRKWSGAGSGPKGFVERILVNKLKKLRASFKGIVRRSAATIVNGKVQAKPAKEDIDFDPNIHCVHPQSPSSQRRLSK